MATITGFLAGETIIDDRFVGTIAFNSENITLPDGSKMSLGIDDGHWVLVYQRHRGTAFEIFEYNMLQRKMLVDGRLGGTDEFRRFKELIRFFFANAAVDDLVTILPPQME